MTRGREFAVILSADDTEAVIAAKVRRARRTYLEAERRAAEAAEALAQGRISFGAAVRAVRGAA